MYSLINLLQNIGLTEKESKAYLINLKIGTNPASVIAKNADLNRCTAYSVLESLVKKGLVYQLEKDGIRYFTAVEPRQIITFIDQQKRDLNYYQQEIDSYLPEFESLKHQHQVIPTIKTYSGKEGIKRLYHEVIKEPCLLIWGRPVKKQHEFFIRYAPYYLKANKEINLLILTNKSVDSHKILKTEELSTIPHIEPIQFTGKNKVFLIIPSENFGIEITHNKLVQFYQDKFKSFWN